jgi:hypothetical protein
MMNMERNSCGLIEVLSKHLPAETGVNYENPVMIISAQPEIQIKHLPNKSLRVLPLGRTVSSHTYYFYLQ